MNSLPNSRRLPRETQPLAILPNQPRFVAFYNSEESDVTISFLDKLLSGRCFRPAVIDYGRLSATQAVEKIATTLDKKGHLLLCIHGVNVSNARGENLGTHYAEMPDGEKLHQTTEGLITRMVNHLGIKPLRVDRPAHGLPFIYLFSCYAGALREQIRPDSDLWKRANLVIFGGKQPTHVLASGAAMAGAVNYIDHCQRSMQTVDPMKLLYFAGLRRGDCITLMGGELSAPLVWHAPKSAHDQGRTDNLAGEAADLHRFEQAVGSLRAADYRLLPAGSLTEVVFNRITRDDAEGLKSLLTAHPELRDMPSEHGPSPLMFAAETMAVECLESLLESGIDPNQKGPDDATALMECVRYDSCSIDCVDLLLMHEANPNLQNSDGSTALIFACDEGHHDAIQALLAHAADPNVQDRTGRTALIYAATNSDAAAIALLISHGAAPDVRCKASATALMRVCLNGHTESASALLTGGANPDARNATGETALMHACEEGYPDIVRLLLDSGANPDLQDKDGMTALMHATALNDVASLDWLLAKGARLDIAANDGRSCLAMAASDKQIESLQRLLAAGARAPEGLNQTLVELTRERGHPQAAALLEQALSAAENAN
jgi:ankyrin repeat protein